MSVTAIVAEIEARAHALPRQNVPNLRILRREYSRQIRSLPPADVLAIATSLLAHARVHRFVADELIASHPAAFAALTRTKLEQLGAANASWDQVDSFATILTGPAWRNAQITDAAIASWAISENRWWRRTALVSTVPLNLRSQGATGDAPRTLQICRLLIDDRDDMVVKAMSWALRALSVQDPKAVSQFLEQNKSRLAPRVIREVKSKLTTGRKTNPSPAT